MRFRSVLVSMGALAAASAAAPAAAHAATVLDTVPAITQVSAWSGTVAWSTYDGGQKAWRLGFSDDGGPPVAAPIPPSPGPFDVDLGRNRNGSTYAVYTRCATPPTLTTPPDRGTGCDV